MGTAKFQANLIKIQSNMLSFALMLTSNREDAYDLLQDTTLKALDNEDKFAADSNFKGWVFTIMRNIFINNYRRSSRSAVVNDSTDNLYHLNMSQESGLETPEGSYTVQEINEAVEAFEPDYREPFSLYLAGYKYQEIADRMGLPLGTIKSRIFTARRRLQTRFASYR